MRLSPSLPPIDNPWVAAQEFIDREELPKEFLDQVAHFIYQNTKGVNIGAASGTPPFNPFSGIITKVGIHLSIPYYSFLLFVTSYILYHPFQTLLLLIVALVKRTKSTVLSFIPIFLWYIDLHVYLPLYQSICLPILRFL
jgi:hypothetical protein